MSNAIPRALLIVLLLMSGCSDGVRAEDYEVGANGEPPKALEGLRVYSKQFVADQKNYVLALGKIHAFLIANRYAPLYSSCFDDVLDIRVTALTEKHKQRFPCVVLQAPKGAPTKAYVGVTVEDVMFNQLDDNNRLIYTVSMYGQDLAKVFVSDVEPTLRELYSGAAPSDSDVGENSESIQLTPAQRVEVKRCLEAPDLSRPGAA